MESDFQSVYLKEIGVITPISAFVGMGQQDVVVETQAVEQKKICAKAEAPPSIPVVGVVESEKAPQKENRAAPVVVSNGDHWAVLKAKAEACKACELVESRNQLVFGDGNENADLVFVGEAPNRDEDLAGKTFVGASGELFQGMLASIGLNRNDVYLLHGVKCRPQHNRAPKPDEFSACESLLSAQLDKIQPKMICLLGRVVAQTMLKTEASLAELRAGQFTYRGIPVLVIDHPSYLLRAQQNKSRAWQDLLHLQSFFQVLH
ncbi:MAG: uracil-DNA glycosylase [Ghiorsea sp.]|nr:uracil-DNA glycosylase [Ghiorsea sp.]